MNNSRSWQREALKTNEKDSEGLGGGGGGEDSGVTLETVDMVFAPLEHVIMGVETR